MDAQSDVGYLTNYFRKLPGALRSNQATHSVAAIGQKAEYFTATHGQSGLRHGINGDTCFPADSPGDTMYQENTKILFLGCSVRSCTMRHLAEYMFMDKYQKKAEKLPNGKELIDRVWCYERWDDHGVWWHVENLYIEELLTRDGKLQTTQCGNATLKLVNSREFVDCCLEQMENRNDAAFRKDPMWDPAITYAWLEEVDPK